MHILLYNRKTLAEKYDLGKNIGNHAFTEGQIGGLPVGGENSP